MSLGDWRTLAETCGTDVDAARAAWAEKLRTHFADPKALAATGPLEALDLAGALGALGDKEAYGVLAYGWRRMPRGRR